jgi:hypothetical protein
MPFPFAAVALGLQGASLASKFFGKSDEQKRQDRYNDLLKSGEKDYREAKSRALARVQKLGAGQIANSRQSAMRRAAAAGRGGEAESFILPAQQGAMDTMQRTEANTEQHYDDQWLDFKSSIGKDFADRPIEPDAFDYISEGLGQGANYMQQRDFIDAMNKYEGGNAGTTTTGTPTVGTTQLPKSALSFNGYEEYESGATGYGGLTPSKIKVRKRIYQ